MRVRKMMSEAYVEAIVTLFPETDIARVRSWFEKRGFSLQRMASGAMLVSGTGSVFADTFGISEEEIDARVKRDVALRVPLDFGRSVKSIAIRRIPSTHSE
jgi:hypothetical protein